MDNPKRSQQSWWQLYALAIIMIGLLILAHYLTPSTGWRTFLDMGVVVLGYGVITVWMEAHSTELLHRSSIEADSQKVESPEVEIFSVMSPPAQFYAGSDPTIIYGMPQHPTSPLNGNGHHPAKTIPSFPEETSNN